MSDSTSSSSSTAAPAVPKAAKVYEDYVTCKQCAGVFQEPVLLDCGHSVCETCAFKQGRSITCPVCQITHTAALNDAGEPVLKKNVVLRMLVAQLIEHRESTEPCIECEIAPAELQCVDCKSNYCTPCSVKFHAKRKQQWHKQTPLGSFTLAECKEHKQKSCEYYCLRCAALVCGECLLIGSHQGHQFASHENALEAAKNGLLQSEVYTQAEQKRAQLSKALENYTRTMGEIDARKTALEKQVRACVWHVSACIEAILLAKQGAWLAQLEKFVATNYGDNETKQAQVSEHVNRLNVLLTKVQKARENKQFEQLQEVKQELEKIMKTDIPALPSLAMPYMGFVTPQDTDALFANLFAAFGQMTLSLTPPTATATPSSSSSSSSPAAAMMVQAPASVRADIQAVQAQTLPPQLSFSSPAAVLPSSPASAPVSVSASSSSSSSSMSVAPVVAAQPAPAPAPSAAVSAPAFVPAPASNNTLAPLITQSVAAVSSSSKSVVEPSSPVVVVAPSPASQQSPVSPASAPSAPAQLAGSLSAMSSGSSFSAQASAASPDHVPEGELQTRVFVIGGYDGKSMLGTVDCYDTKSATWLPIAKMSSARYGPCACDLGGRVYVMGGMDDRQQYQATCEAFDPIALTWSALPSLNQKRGYASACSNAGNVYVMGGFDQKEYLQSAECLQADGSQWVTLAPMKTRRRGTAACSLNDRVYVLGGNDGARNWLETVETYDAQAGWMFCDSMNSKRYSLAAAALDGLIYAAGGLDAQGARLNTVECWDPRATTHKWTALEPMSNRRSGSSACAVDGKLYVCGGYSGSTYLNNAEVYDPRNAKWSIVPMPCRRESLAACKLEFRRPLAVAFA